MDCVVRVVLGQGCHGVVIIALGGRWLYNLLSVSVTEYQHHASLGDNMSSLSSTGSSSALHSRPGASHMMEILITIKQILHSIKLRTLMRK